LNRCCATNTALGRQRRPATEKPHQPLLRVRLVWPGRRQSVAALTGWRVHRAWARCRVVRVVASVAAFGPTMSLGLTEYISVAAV